MVHDDVDIAIRSVFTGPFWNWRLDVERWPGYSPVVDNDKISVLVEISIAGVGFQRSPCAYV